MRIIKFYDGYYLFNYRRYNGIRNRMEQSFVDLSSPIDGFSIRHFRRKRRLLKLYHDPDTLVPHERMSLLYDYF